MFHAADAKAVDMVNQFRGGSRRVLLGFDEPPSETKKFFEAILVRDGAEFGEVNRLGVT